MLERKGPASHVACRRTFRLTGYLFKRRYTDWLLLTRRANNRDLRICNLINSAECIEVGCHVPGSNCVDSGIVLMTPET